MQPDDEVPCGAIASKKACANHGCVYDDEVLVCHGKDERMPCHLEGTEKRCATRDDCHWDQDVCEPNVSQLRCVIAETEDSCGQHDFCMWLPGEKRCIFKDDDISCHHLLQESSCNMFPDKCAWNSAAKVCHPKEGLKCKHIYQEHTCMQLPQCAYDGRLQRCRRLKTPRHMEL